MGKKNYARCVDLFRGKEITQEYPDRYKQLFRENKYLLSLCRNSGKIRFQALQILECNAKPSDLKEANRYDDPEPVFCQIPEWWEPNVSQIINEETLNYDLKETKKLINDLIGGLDATKAGYMLKPYTSEFSDFYTEHVLRDLAFDQKDDSDELKRNVYKVYIDVLYVVGLNELKPIVQKYIDENKIITNLDKTAISLDFSGRVENKPEEIVIDRKADLIMSDYIQIHCDDEKKEIIFAQLSPMEFRVPFSFFWTQVKNMLSMAFIPAILLYITTADNKKPIYIPLAIVYFITLILADEKQVDRIRDGMEKRGHSVNYATLFYIGILPVVYLILFSVEMAFADKFNTSGITLADLAIVDVPLCYTVYLLISLIAILISWITVKLSKSRRAFAVIEKIGVWGMRILFYGGTIWMAKLFLWSALTNDQPGLMTILSAFVVLIGISQLAASLKAWKKRKDKDPSNTDDNEEKPASA